MTIHFSGAVLSNIELMPQIHELWLEVPYPLIASRPGQFVMVRCGQGYDPLLRRPFSIHRVRRNANATEIALLFSVCGRGTKWLSQRQNGDNLDIIGPLGNGFAIKRDRSNLLLVAGGIGIAPLVFLAGEAIKSDCLVTLLLGAQTADQIYPSSQLPPEIEVVIATEDGSAGRKCLVTDLLAEYVEWANQVFACGPTSMYQAMSSACPDLVISEKSVQVLLEVGMACGLGACYGCAVVTRRGLKLVCKDGPRFELRDIIASL